MSSTFVLAPVPAGARRRRANSRTAPSTNCTGRSRSGSNASYTGTRTRSRSRRPSLRHAPSVSFINFVDTPSDAKYTAADWLKSPATPSHEQINAHLQALGYQTSFLKSANQSPRPIFRRIFSKSQPTTPHDPFHKGPPAVPPVPKIKIPVPALPKTPSTKKPKQYSKTNVRPLMYAQEVQLAMFFEGGREKDHIARAAAKTTKGMSADEGLPGGGREVGGYKDESGMLWWDEDEQWEWAALLPREGNNDTDDHSTSHDDSTWVDFEGAFEGRSSASSASSDKSVDALLDELEQLMSTMGAGPNVGRRLEALLPPRCVLAMPRPRARSPKAQGAAYLFPVVELAHTKNTNTNTNSKPTRSPSTTSFSARRTRGAGRRRRAGPPPPLTLEPARMASSSTVVGVVGVVGPIASARHFQFKHAHSHSFDDALVAREAEFAWASLVGNRAAPKSAGLPKKSGKMAGLFKGFGKSRKQGTP